MPKNLVFCLLLVFVVIACSKPAAGLGNRGPLQIDIWADRDCVKAGEVVKLRAVATNRGETAQAISLQNKPVLDIRIAYSTRTDSITPDIIQHWSDGRELNPEDQHLELSPGESKGIEMDWVAQNAAGRFGQIDLQAILRYGERDSDVAVGRTRMSVNTCS